MSATFCTYQQQKINLVVCMDGWLPFGCLQKLLVRSVLYFYTLRRSTFNCLNINDLLSNI